MTAGRPVTRGGCAVVDTKQQISPTLLIVLVLLLVLLMGDL